MVGLQCSNIIDSIMRVTWKTNKGCCVSTLPISIKSELKSAMELCFENEDWSVEDQQVDDQMSKPEE